jgi:hypothetical protein
LAANEPILFFLLFLLPLESLIPFFSLASMHVGIHQGGTSPAPLWLVAVRLMQPVCAAGFHMFPDEVKKWARMVAGWI